MSRKLLFLVGMFCVLTTSWAGADHELIKNLDSRLHSLPEGRGSLIKSFTNHSQSYIYDQALAIIAFTKNNDQAKARKLLSGLKSLQLDDGSLYFSYYLNGKSPYPEEGDKRFAGAIAWVALSAVHYQHKFKSKEFLNFNFRILSYLESQMHPLKVSGIKTRAISFAPVDVTSTPWKENDVAALEHNLDAYAAFQHFAEINNHKKWLREIQQLKKFILAMWDKKQSHFWSGASFKTGQINKSELYLDNQSWSLLALDQKTLQKIKPDEALNLNCDAFYVKHEGVNGFMDSKPVRRPASSKFVWSEGTLGQVLAMSKITKINKKALHCQGKNSDDYLISIKKMKKSDGGIAYSTTTPNPDFTNASSVAGTAWLYFAANDFNPFHIEGLN